jgi:NAD(P)H dehydrogenase (quinone)
LIRKVGAIVANTLLAADLPVRAVVRNEDKASDWRARGCDIAIVPTPPIAKR